MRILWCIPVFVAGFVVAINVTSLAETNPNYEASWEKVVFAVVLAIAFSVMATSRK